MLLAFCETPAEMWNVKCEMLESLVSGPAD